MGGIFRFRTNYPRLKQLQLLAWRFNSLRLAIAEYLHVAKLFVGNT